MTHSKSVAFKTTVLEELVKADFNFHRIDLEVHNPRIYFMASLSTIERPENHVFICEVDIMLLSTNTTESGRRTAQ